MWLIFSVHLKVSEISTFMPVENVVLCEYCGFTWQVAEHHTVICSPPPYQWDGGSWTEKNKVGLMG